MGVSLAPCGEHVCHKALIIASPCPVKAKPDEVPKGPLQHRARVKCPDELGDPNRFLGQHVRDFDTSEHHGHAEVAEEITWALRHCDSEKLSTALARGSANVNCRTLRGLTPLMMAAAASNRSKEMCQALLSAKAEVESKDEKGWTPLLHACSSNNIDAIDLLLEKGASLHRKAHDGKGCIILAFVGSEDVKLIKHLVHRGASVDDRDANGWSLLFYACEHQNLQIIRWLWTKFQMDLETKATDGLTCVDILKRQGLGQPHRWLGARRRPEMDYLLIDLGLMHEDGSMVEDPSHHSPRSRRRSSKSQGEHSKRSSQVSNGSNPRRSSHSEKKKGSKEGSGSHPSSRRSSKGAFAPESLEESQCAAVVTMHVTAHGEQFRDVFIPEPAKANVPGIHDEEEVMNRLLEAGYNVA